MHVSPRSSLWRAVFTFVILLALLTITLVPARPALGQTDDCQDPLLCQVFQEVAARLNYGLESVASDPCGRGWSHSMTDRSDDDGIQLHFDLFYLPAYDFDPIEPNYTLGDGIPAKYDVDTTGADMAHFVFQLECWRFSVLLDTQPWTPEYDVVTVGEVYYEVAIEYGLDRYDPCGQCGQPEDPVDEQPAPAPTLEDLCANVSCENEPPYACFEGNSYSGPACDPQDGLCKYYYFEQPPCGDAGCNPATGRCYDAADLGPAEGQFDSAEGGEALPPGTDPDAGQPGDNPDAQPGIDPDALAGTDPNAGQPAGPADPGAPEPGVIDPDSDSSDVSTLLGGLAVIALGGAAATAAAAVPTYLGIRALRRRQQLKEGVRIPHQEQQPTAEQQAEQQATQYRLTTSLKGAPLRLQAGGHGTVQVQAWVSTPAGSWTPAAQVPITVSAAAGLQIAPATGVGTLNCSVTGQEPGRYVFDVRGSAPSGTLTAQVAVEIKPAPAEVIIDPAPVVVRAGEVGTVRAAVWRPGSGGRVLVPEAVLRLQVAGGRAPERARIVPSEGEGGKLASSIWTDAPDFPNSETLTLKAVARMPDGELITAEAPLRVEVVQVARSLEITPPSLKLDPGGSAEVEITALKASPAGGWEEDGEMIISLEPPAELALGKGSGIGRVRCMVTARPETRSGDWRIRVRGEGTGGSAEISAVLPVQVVELTREVVFEPAELELEPGEKIEVKVTAYRAGIDGRREVDNTVVVKLEPVQGCDIYPQSEVGSLSSTLWARGEAEPGAYTLRATTEGSGALPAAECRLTVIQPQTWHLTLKKVLWQDQERIDLRDVSDELPARWRALEREGGQLVVKPIGFVAAGYEAKELETTRGIGGAAVCQLERGDGASFQGVWDEVGQSYLFRIPAGGAEGGRGDQEIAVKIRVAIHQGWGERVRQVLATAGELGAGLRADLRDHAEGYAIGLLDQLARHDETALNEQRERLQVRLLNTRNYLRFLKTGTLHFDRSLSLFGAAFGRMRDNLINLYIEIAFVLFDLFTKVFKSAAKTAKAALVGATGEAVESAVKKSVTLLEKEAIEQETRITTAKTARDNVRKKLLKAEALLKEMPAGTSNHTKQLALRAELLAADQAAVRQVMTEQADLEMIKHAKKFFSEQIQANAGKLALEEFQQVMEQAAREMKDLPEIQTLLKEAAQQQAVQLTKMRVLRTEMESMIKALGEDATESAALRTLSDGLQEQIERMMREGLWEFNKNAYTDLLAKQPLANMAQKAHDAIGEAKVEAKKIRYENVEWKHYEGWLSPVWFLMDWSIEQIVYLYDLARNYIPGIIALERWLSYAVDTAISNLVWSTNAALAFMQSHSWSRSSIAGSYRERGKNTAMRSGGVSKDFFIFPQTPKQLVQQCQPQNVVAMGQNGSGAEKLRVQQVIQTGVESSLRQETGFQKEQAKAFFGAMCIRALDPKLLERSYQPQQVEQGDLDRIWQRLETQIVAYEEGFEAAGAKGTDYLLSVGRFQEDATYQDLDGKIEWMAWGVAWALRLGAMAALVTGYGAVATVPLFTAAQAVEWIAALLRPAVAALGTMPDVIGFHFDVIIAAALGYEAIITENVDMAALVVESYAVD